MNNKEYFGAEIYDSCYSLTVGGTILIAYEETNSDNNGHVRKRKDDDEAGG